MQVLLNEEQQIEFIKRGWDRFGGFIVAFVLSVVLLIAGMQLWNRYYARQAEAASILYESLVEAVEKNDADTATHQMAFLSKQYTRTIYASYANLLLAKKAIDKKEFGKAAEYFKWVQTNTSNIVLKELANVRLARLLINQEKYDAALSLMAHNRFKVFTPLMRELEGDAALALGHVEQARMSYKKALDESTLARPLLKMKWARLSQTDSSQKLAKNKMVTQP